MPARKRPLSHPGDNHEDHPMPDSEVVNGDDGDGNGGGGGGSALPFPSSSVQEEEIRRQEEEEEKPQLGTTDVEQQEQKGEERVDDDGAPPPQDVKKNDPEADADNGDSSFLSDDAEEEKPEYVLIELADIRREVQCPICLGIIRKTRTVMDCLHRFCRECIDRSMRLGNNECPACRTHCASRRSLRDDPNYDALIAVLYPDIDKYEEEELALRDEELMRNKKIQAYISETFQRQSEALGRRRSSVKSSEAGFMRRSQRNFRSGRGYSRGGGRSSARSATTNGSAVSSAAVSDNEEEVNDGTGTEGNDDPSSETGRQKRCRRWAPARAHPGLERSHDEPEEMTNREMLAWGKNGVRSQTRHGGSGGSSGKANRVDRISRLVDHLHSLDEDDDELDLQLRLIPADDEGKMIPSLERPFLCCRPSLSIKQLAQFIGMQMDMEAEEVEILMEKKLEEQESLGHFQSCFSTPPFDLVLAYRARRQQERERGSSPAGEGPPSSQYEFL